MSNRSFTRGLKAMGVIIIASLTWKSNAQTYNFSNYGLKEGLAQSQVTTIFQDHNRNLWLGTYGGVSSFNGKEFFTLSKANGLSSNMVNSITEDEKGRIILGTDGGLSILSNPKISNIDLPDGAREVQKDKNGKIWGISKDRLFRMEEDEVKFYPADFARDVTCISRDRNGALYAAAYGKGIYKLNNGSWKLVRAYDDGNKNLYIRKVLVDEKNPRRMYLLSPKAIWVVENSTFKPFYEAKGPDNMFFAIEQDREGNLWLGTQKGAWFFCRDGAQTHFKADNGLSDNRINRIFRDVENNIWLSSFGDGIFKYEGESIIRLNKFGDKDFNLQVSSITPDKNGDLWIGTFNKGLFQYKNQSLLYFNKPGFQDKTVFYSCRDAQGNVWISVQGNGIWRYDGKNFNQVITQGKLEYNTILVDSKNDLWFTEPIACYYIKDGVQHKIEGFKGYSCSIFQMDEQSVLLGTTSGVSLIRNYKLEKNFHIKGLENTNVMAIIRYQGRILFGTLGDGIIAWDPKSGKIEKYTTLNGLSSNDVYSLTTDDKQTLWAGTGRGVNSLSADKRSGKLKVITGAISPLVVECNQNAIVNYKNKIWLGSINGLILCAPEAGINQVVAPYVYIRRMYVFHQKDNRKDSLLRLSREIPKNIRLKYNQNHVSINFRGIFLTNPGIVRYEYRLLGLDEDFSKPMKMEDVEYSFLKAGTYTFEVRAVTTDGLKSNTAQLKFTVVPPFYETFLFKLGVFILLIAGIFGAQHYMLKARINRKRYFEKIKQDEQLKIRKQTAEDFHDDIGNKLTRINVLSEILDKKVNSDRREEKELIRLIRENAGTLYTGTKDILWALDPQSDNLFEILNHIREFGIDLFQNTGVEFQMTGLLPDYQKVQLSMEFNRNLSLIFKEILNNALKYSGATEVQVKVFQTEKHTVRILVRDNGKGFDPEKTGRGRGLNNIRTRCKRIDSDLFINSSQDRGTAITISTRISVTI